MKDIAYIHTVEGRRIEGIVEIDDMFHQVINLQKSVGVRCTRADKALATCDCR